MIDRFATAVAAAVTAAHAARRFASCALLCASASAFAASPPAPAPPHAPAPAAAPAPPAAPAPAPSPAPSPSAPARPAARAAAACVGEVAGMACIPGGAFIRGTDTGPKNARPAAKVWQDTYYMDVHEVTMADYRACRKTKACPPAKPLYGDFSRPRQPMVAMSWYDAVSYCRWRGKHLPTEAEWEKAARGPDGDVFPWGSAPATCERAIIEDKRGRSCGVRKKGNKPHVGRTFEIGSRPAYRYGLHDMAGNAWEWVADWYSPSYAACGEACIKDNPKGPCDGAARCPGHDQKLVKGGSWYWKAQYATGFYRRPHDPINKPISHFGFRCAASLDEARALRAAKP